MVIMVFAAAMSDVLPAIEAFDDPYLGAFLFGWLIVCGRVSRATVVGAHAESPQGMVQITKQNRGKNEGHLC